MRIISGRRILFLLPLLMWGAFIFYLSSQPYQEQTIIPFLKRNISQQQLSQLVPDVTIKYGKSSIPAKRFPYHFVEVVFRKTAHLFVYCVFGGLVYLVMLPYRLRIIFKLSIAIGLVAITAALDELNQMQHALRTGAIQDVGIDLIGGSFGSLLLMLFWRKRFVRTKGFHRSNLQ